MLRHEFQTLLEIRRDKVFRNVVFMTDGWREGYS